MLTRFYFDFSDYRSYLMLPTLDALAELSIQIQWIAVDAYSLRALSGISVPDTNAERAYLKQEATRFAEANHLPFIWQNERLRSGHALRACVWLMQNAPETVEPFARKMLTALWAYGQTPDITLVKTTLESLINDNDIIDTIFSDVAAHDGFIYQDTCLQQALADGAFDVPTVSAEEMLFCRFDQIELTKRACLKTALKKLNPDTILTAYIDLLSTLSVRDRRDAINEILKPQSIETSPVPQTRQSIAVKPQITAPQSEWKLPRFAVRENMIVRAVSYARGSVYPFADVVDQAADNALTLVSQVIEFTSQKAMLQVVRTAPAGRTLLARVHDGAQIKTLFAQTGDSTPILVLLDEETPYIEFTLQSWRCFAVSPAASRDIHLARRAAHLGTNLIIRVSQSDDDPSSEAWGLVSGAWVAELSDKIHIIDSESSRTQLRTSAEIRLTPAYCLKQKHIWSAPAPRTILLTEHPITIGSLAAGASLEFSCRMQNLEVTTGLQNCELSSTRTSERLRLGEALIQVIPLAGDQICIPELVTHKLLETLNRAHAESVPLLVNYWNDIEFDMLEKLRPLHAAIVSLWRIPLVTVVLNQIVEVWQCSAQGTAYRIEKENDCFTLDLDESPRTDVCFEQMIARLELSADEFLKRVDFYTNSSTDL